MTEDDTDDTDDTDESNGINRRGVLAATAGIGIGGLFGAKTGSKPASGATTSGSTIGTRTTPAAAVYTDRLRLVDNDRTLSENGDMRYNP